MRNRRCKTLKKLVLENDEKTIESIRKHIGKKAVLMKSDKLYKKAKKLWSNNKLYK